MDKRFADSDDNDQDKEELAPDTSTKKMATDEEKVSIPSPRSRSLSQLYREGNKKEWKEKALDMLSEELKDEELSLRMDVHGPKLLQISIDLLRETNPTPTQQTIFLTSCRQCPSTRTVALARAASQMECAIH